MASESDNEMEQNSDSEMEDAEVRRALIDGIRHALPFSSNKRSAKDASNLD